jgi:hypothetical protein
MALVVRELSDECHPYYCKSSDLFCKKVAYFLAISQQVCASKAGGNLCEEKNVKAGWNRGIFTAERNTRYLCVLSVLACSPLLAASDTRLG